MIVVNKNGMMIACKLLRENDKAWIVKYNDHLPAHDIRVPKDSGRRLFASVDDALEWLDN